ncbi:MAG: SMP-30/gluconolactonase/LRE family protein [Burkholderiales bacterium]
MDNLDLQRLYTVDNGLLEGPRYDERTNDFIFSDARNGGVLSIAANGTVKTVIAHRRGIGGIALHESGGCVVTGRNVAFKHLDVAGQAQPTIVLIERDESTGRVGFNDLTTDALGRIYVGSMAFIALDEDVADPNLPAGDFWMIDTDGSVQRVAEDIRITNGTALSADGKTLYLSDSGRRVVFSFAVDPQSGRLGKRSVFAECKDGVPDGMAVAVDGSVWLTLAFAGQIVRYSAEGRTMQVFSIPDLMVTSLCFGGADRRTLYVVTGTPGKNPHDKAYVYATTVGIAGIPVALARTPTGDKR